jgi:hypothetical protein
MSPWSRRRGYDDGVSLVRLVVVLVAGVAAVAGYLQEGRRLEAIRRLPGEQARDYYEAGRARGEGAMWVITVVLVIAAVVMTFKDGLPPPFATGGGGVPS